MLARAWFLVQGSQSIRTSDRCHATAQDTLNMLESLSDCDQLRSEGKFKSQCVRKVTILLLPRA